MKQKMKRVMLVLCMAICLLSLSACAKKDASSEQVPKAAASLMVRGAVGYLVEFDSLSDEQIDAKIQRSRKQEDKVMYDAYQSWKTSKKDLGSLVKMLSEKVTRVGEDSYKIHVQAQYEKRDLDFYLTAVEEDNSDDSAVTMLTTLKPTELVFSPVFTTGEKLEKAALNTLMGMGTVFVVLIFISFIISRFKSISVWEAKLKAGNHQETEAQAQGSAPVSQTAVQTPVQLTPAPAPPVPAASKPAPAALSPVPAAPQPVLSPAAGFQTAPASLTTGAQTGENLKDDLELVAVITAAISAAAGVPAEGLIVRSIRRRSASNWKKA